MGSAFGGTLRTCFSLQGAYTASFAFGVRHSVFTGVALHPRPPTLVSVDDQVFSSSFL